MSISLKDRIAGAEHDAVTEESPIAAIFQSAQVAAQSKEPKQAINQASTVTQSQAYPQLRDLPADALDEMEQPFRLYSEKKLEEMKLDVNFDYSKVHSLRKEAVQKLNLYKPMSIGQASRISGVSPADLSVLLVYLEQLRHGGGKESGDERRI